MFRLVIQELKDDGWGSWISYREVGRYPTKDEAFKAIEEVEDYWDFAVQEMVNGVWVTCTSSS